MRIHTKVVSDRFDDEVIIVNLESGSYYSFKRTAMDLWGLLEEGIEENRISAVFINASSNQLKELTDFIDFLKTENLVISYGIVAEASAQSLTFESLEYSKYEDMADLIMIDPIHEADPEKGWPHKQEEPK